MFESNNARLRWRRLIGPLGLALFTGVLVGCAGGGPKDGTGNDNPSAGHFDAGGLPTLPMPARWAWGDADRLETLTGSADAVFSGTIVALKGQRRMLSQPSGGESRAPGPRWADIPVSQFEVRVESAVSGSLTAGSEVTVEQIGGVETRPDGTQVRIILHGDEPLEVGQKYLLFGSFQQDGSIVAPPFGRMKVLPDGSLTAEASWAHLGAMVELTRSNLGDAERQIKAIAGE